MKIRTGFVSNSSSSSFCMYGVSIRYDQMIEILEELDKMPEDNIYDDDIGFWLEYEDNTIFPNLEIRHHCDAEEIYIGEKWENIGEEETGNQFKNRVAEEIEKCLGKKLKCHTVEGIISN